MTPVENGVQVIAFDGATPFYLKCAGAVCQPRHEWYRNCFLPVEKERGLDDLEDHLFAALFQAKLKVGTSVTFVASTDATAGLDGAGVRAESAEREAKLLQSWLAENEKTAADSPNWLPQLVLAADQFIVKRSMPEFPDGRSIIAGYHWFGDWGRDTMIALPGLTLATGRADVARQILLAFAEYVDGGMLPNNFPDVGGQPQYNSVDAALWFFEAVRQYFAVTKDGRTLLQLFPTLGEMIDAHVKGTRYNIHVDPADGLLYAGEPGVQLTWMDAKVGDWVVTPRTGKAVEVNALWINALETMAEFARLLARPGEGYEKLSAKARKNFQKFWNEERGCCFDVIEVPRRGERRVAAAESTSGRFASGYAVDRGAAEIGRGRLRSASADLVRAAQFGAGRAGIPGTLCGRTEGSRRGLPSGNGMGLAAGAICAGALARVRRPCGSDALPRAAGHFGAHVWARYSGRDFRGRSSIHAAWVYRAGLDRWRSLARDAGSSELSRILTARAFSFGFQEFRKARSVPFRRREWEPGKN